METETKGGKYKNNNNISNISLQRGREGQVIYT